MKRKTLAMLCAVALLFVLTLTGTLIWLGSSSGLSWTLNKARGFLAENQQMQLDFASVKGSLWSGFEIWNLKLRIEKPALKVDVDLTKVRLDYDVSIWGRKLEVRELVINGPKLNVSVNAKTEKELAEELAAQLAEEKKHPKKSWQDQLAGFPVHLVINKIDVNIDTLNFEKKDQEKEVKSELHHFLWVGDMHAEAGFFELNSGVTAADGSQFRVAKMDSLMQSQLSFSAQLGITLKKDGPDWSLRWKPLAIKSELRSFIMTKSGGARTAVDHINTQITSLEEGDRAGVHYVINVSGIKNAALSKPLDCMVDGEFSTPVENLGRRLLSSQQIKDFSAFFKMNVLDHEIFEWVASGKNNDQSQWALEGDLKFDFQHSLFEWVTKLKKWEASAPKGQGHFKVLRDTDAKINFQSNVEIPKLLLPNSAAPVAFAMQSELQLANANSELKFLGHLSAKHTKWGDFRVDSNLDFEKKPETEDFRSHGITEITIPEISGNTFIKPVVISHDVSGRRENLELHLKATVPALQLKSGPLLQNNVFAATVGINKISGAKKISNLLFLIDNSAIKISGELSEALATHDLQGEFKTAVDLGEPLALGPNTTLQGKITWPLFVRYSSNKELTLMGPVQFAHLNFKGKQFALSDLSGDLPIRESVRMAPFAFTNLLTENPFERVQFDQVRPLINQTHPLRAEKIIWQEKQYGPMIGFVSLDQNRFFVHQLDLNMGAGQIYGEFFADVEPQSYQSGFLGRISNLDLNQVLPKKFTVRQELRSNVISARAGMVLNVNKSSVTGRMDVTELGSGQLVSMLNLLDPDYRNEKFNKMRGLLKLGYPTAIFVGFANGYMDLQVDLSILGVSNHQSVEAIPISSLISKSLSKILQKKPAAEESEE